MASIRIWEPQFRHSLATNLGGAAKLLVTQNDGLIWNVIPGFGLIYLFSLPLALIGFFLLCRQCLKREFTPAYFILAWCITTALLSAVVVPNVNRLNIGLVPLVYCAVLGVSFFQDRLRIVFYGLVGLYAASFVAFTWTYFTTYPAQVAPKFASSFTEAIVAASQDPHAKVCITSRIELPYIFVLFANKEDPREFLRTARYSNPRRNSNMCRRSGATRLACHHRIDRTSMSMSSVMER